MSSLVSSLKLAKWFLGGPAVRHGRIRATRRLAFQLIMPTSPNRGAGAYATGDPAAAYPWGWLAVVGTVIVLMIAGAGWLYQKRGEWRVGAADDARTVAPKHVPQPAMAAGPESNTGPEPPGPLPLTMVDIGAERSAQHVGSVSPVHAPETASIPSSTYIIRRGDTLMAIAAHHYGDAFQWTVIAQANPEADPRRLRVGQEIQLPPGSSQSRQVP